MASLGFMRICAFVALGTSAACTSSFEPFNTDAPRLTPVQECSIGYDLAQQIYRNVSLIKTVIIAPSKKTNCETYALKYLQAAGFKIDDRKTTGGFDVELVDREGFVVTATATVGERLKISRDYQTAETGVYAASDVAILELPAEAVLR